MDLNKIRLKNAISALPIICKGPIHLDDLAAQLHTSKIEAGHAVNILRRTGEKVKYKGDIVSIREGKS